MLINPNELERLERSAQAARRLAFALGQDEAILERVKRRELHPAMVAYGLWRDDPDLLNLADEIETERQRPA